MALGAERARKLSSKEILQVRERVSRRLPFFIIKDTKRNRGIAIMWQIPGTLVRVSEEGDIFYPVWRERAWVNRPELYIPCSAPPHGWSFERLLASKRRPISEIIFHQIKKDEGSVEAAIRNMDHVLARYQKWGEELEQVNLVQAQVDQAILVLNQKEIRVSREEFNEAFESLSCQTLGLMERIGMTRARLALKKDLNRLLEQASTGRDRLGRPNMLVMLKKLEAALRRVEYRRDEAQFIETKFLTMKVGLAKQAEMDEKKINDARYELRLGFAAHTVFKLPGKKIPQWEQKILFGKIGNLVYRLGGVKVKPYRPVAAKITESLKRAQELVKNQEYAAAKEIFNQALFELA